MTDEYDVWKEIELGENEAPCGSTQFYFKAFGLYGKQYPRLVIKIAENGCDMWILCYKQTSKDSYWENSSVPLSLKKHVKEML